MLMSMTQSMGVSTLACHPRRRYGRRAGALALFSTVALALLVLLAPACASGAITTFGSPLSVPATLNTSENLDYQGTDTLVPPAPDAPDGVVHTTHYGADTALWNVALAGGLPAAPVAGQALRVSLEGCARPAAGGPAPLTQIHFQSLSPLVGGGAKVNLSSQPFDIPVCGAGGASGATVTSYEPVNLCVNQGDYVGFNDNGGYEPNYYRSGVPYQVLGAVGGSSADSFIRGGATGNGAVFSPSDRTAMDGFASNPGEELMLQVTLGSGPDAMPACGGTHGLAASGAPRQPTTPVKLLAQTDGVNHHRIVSVAIFCRLATPCTGVAELKQPGRRAHRARVGAKRFSIPAKRTSHVAIRVSPRMIRQLRKHRHGARALLTVAVAGKLVRHTIRLRIYAR
jgi:hypothetical protein